MPEIISETLDKIIKNAPIADYTVLEEEKKVEVVEE